MKATTPVEPSFLEPLSSRLKRRMVTLPALVVVCTLGLTLALVVLPFTLTADLLTGPKRRRFSRVVGVVLIAASTHLIYLPFCLANGLVSMVHRELGLHIDRWLQKTWATLLFRGVCGALGMRLLDAEGPEADPARPVLVLVRHSSILDVFMPILFVANCGHPKLRYVIKSQLKSNGLLDLVGQRLPNAFIDRMRSEESRAAVHRLGEGLAPGGGVVIYPEGSRMTSKRRQQALQRLEDAGHHNHAERARALKHLMPPRPGGVLALLDQVPEAQICFMAHAGVEHLTGFAHAVSGKVYGKAIRVHRTIIQPEAVPKETDARVEWLWQHWEAMDEWLENNPD